MWTKVKISQTVMTICFRSANRNATAILGEDERLVVIRFGRDHDSDCMRQDEVLYRIADKVKNFAVV